LQQYEVNGIVLKYDNRNQFITYNVREFSKEKQAAQELKHVVIHEVNGFIEAIIVEREVL